MFYCRIIDYLLVHNTGESNRSSRPYVYGKKAVLINLVKLTEKHRETCNGTLFSKGGVKETSISGVSL